MATSFTPSPAELALTTQIFSQFDPKKLGALTGDVAVKAFGGANLSPIVLGEIWQVADESNNGWLSQKGVAMALRLIGHAQKGEKVSAALLSKPGPLPTIAGLTPMLPQGTGASASRARSPPPGLPPFTPQDKAKFHNMFINAGPVDGVLAGEKAQEIFIKSKLPNETLGLIWNLSDTQDRGKLDATDFAIGMYLIQGVMTGQIPTVPSSLPPGFYQQVAGSSPSAIRSQTTGGTYSPLASSFSLSQSPRSNIQPQYTGASQQALQPQATGPWSSKPPVPPHLPARPTVSASAIGSGAFGSSQPQWDITPAEKASSDRWFDSLDTTKRGYIQDDVAVPFLLESKLSGEDLAQIWDLADINSDGCLTRDGFAIAWHLIQKKRAGAPIPTTLPPSLIPPSMRAPAAAASSPFSAPAPPEPPKDLFSWDDPVPTPTPAPAVPTPLQQLSPQHTAFSSPPRADPFGSANAISRSPAPPTDLLGDDDDTAIPSPPIHDKSAEIGNVQNQVNSTSRSLATAQAERQALETTLANQAAQLSALQTQLSTAKAAYETETKLLAGLRERQATQTAEINKTREELIRGESDLSAVRVEKSEIEGAFLRDKEEARALHKKMVDVSGQIDIIKVEVEKSKKDAKQQKGLLAIARKQLSSKEAERAKVEKELQDAQAEATTIAAEKEQVEGAIATLDAQPLPTFPVAAPTVNPPERTTSEDSLTFAASKALPSSPAPDAGSSSLASSIKSNNPFDRLMGNTTPRSQSPFAGSLNVLSPDAINETTPAPDPFGFARAFETDAVEAPTEAPTEVAESLTPKQVGLDALSPASEQAMDDGATSESDVFSTPLTALGPAFPASNNVVADKLPAVERSENNLPGHFEPDPTPIEAETDLGAPLKEIEAQESDSSDSDDDEVPLATLAKAKQAEAAAETGTPAAETNDDAKPAETFDDVFGVSSAPEPAPTEALTGAFGMPVSNNSFSTSANGFAASASPAVAGVDVFDETLGKIPATTSTPATFNAFDSAFDDNFDFSSASAAAETPFPPAPTAATNGHAASPLPASASKNEFDSIFMATGNQSTSTSLGGPSTSTQSNGSADVAWAAPAITSQPSQPTNGAVKPAGPSFDEAFGGFDTGTDVNNLSASLDPSPKAPAPSVSTDVPVQPFPKTLSPTASPKSVAPSSQGASRRSMSPPPRHRSPPPPRPTTASKGRSSTGSSKEEKSKEKDAPAPRHSKLSIRLPFGKKKNKDKAEPLPSAPAQHLTPPQEEPSGTTTPAVEDDVEAVKQLTAMGFSRSQAVDALEIHAYDVQRALNSLLGAQ